MNVTIIQQIIPGDGYDIKQFSVRQKALQAGRISRNLRCQFGEKSSHF
jgi:hypothetical protein